VSVELDVRAFLLGPAAAVSGCSAGFTFVGPMRPSKGGFPAEAVTIQEYGGPQPHGYLDGRNQTYRQVDVQIRVRGAIGQYLTTKGRADRIWNALNRCSGSSFSSATRSYIRIEPLTSGPQFLGEDDTESPEFALSVRLGHHT